MNGWRELGSRLGRALAAWDRGDYAGAGSEGLAGVSMLLAQLSDERPELSEGSQPGPEAVEQCAGCGEWVVAGGRECPYCGGGAFWVQ